MLPYFELTKIPYLGSDLFSFFFFMAFVSGYLFGLWSCRKKGLTFSEFNEFFCFTIIPACFGAHVFHVIAYNPRAIISDPAIFLRMNAGLSSMGGVLTFLIFFYVFVNFRKKIHWKEWLNIAAQGYMVGLTVGRIGCSLVHDHLGRETTFILGLKLQNGLVRHDLGLYEFLFLACIVLPVSFFYVPKLKIAGAQFLLLAFLYAPVRFIFEFLRIGERRYYDLTPAQYACVILLLCGVLVYRLPGQLTNPRLSGKLSLKNA